MYQLPPKLGTRVISELLMRPSPLDVWLRLPKNGNGSGSDGHDTSSRSESTPTSRMSPSAPKSEQSPVLLNGCGQVTTATELKSLVHESRRQFAPSARRANWTSGTTLLYRAPERYLKPLELQFAGFRKKDPIPVPEIAVPVAVPNHVWATRHHSAATERNAQRGTSR